MLVRKIWSICVAVVGGSFSPSRFLDLNSSERKAGVVVGNKLLDGPHFFGQLRWITPHSNIQITIHAVEEANPIRTESRTLTETIIQAPRKQTPVQAPAQYDTRDGLITILSDYLVQLHDHVIIIDSMAVVLCMKNARA